MAARPLADGEKPEERITPSPPIDPYDSAWLPPQLGQYNCPLRIFLGANYQWRAVATGALVFDQRNRLLIIQENATNKFANRWKIPGASVKDDDRGVLHALGRGLLEEAGLNLSLVVRQVGPGMEVAADIANIEIKSVKFSFEVEVAELPEVGVAGRINRASQSAEPGIGAVGSRSLPVKLDPSKHQRYLWVSENEMRRANYQGEPLEFVSSELRRTLCAGFAIRRKDLERAFTDLLPLNEVTRSTDRELWRREIESGYYMTKNWDNCDISDFLRPDARAEDMVFENTRA